MASPKRNTVRRINFSIILAVLIGSIAGFALSVKVLSRVSDDSALASPARDTDRQTQTKPKLEDARDASPLGTTSGKIAFGRGSFGRFDVWTLDDIGGTNVPMQLTDTNEYDPVFSADGKKILFRSFRDGETGSGFNEIYSMNPDGYDQTRLTSDATGEANASYSPDSTQIVFLRDGNVWKMNADGTNQTMLADLESGIQNPSYSPDGSKIVFEHIGGIWLINADGTNQTPLNNSNGTEKPRFSTDGTKIIYDSNSSVYTINIDGTNEIEIINGNSNNYELANPIYSPDGTKIVMECRVVTDVNVCTANADGTGFLAQAGTNVERSNPVWAPDSISIAYLDRNRITNKYRIFTNTINGTPTQVYLEDSNEILQYLAWQPVCIDMPTPTPTPLPGPISEWNANNSTAADSTGTNNGQFRDNAGLIDPGKVGLGFYFPGNGGYIEVPDSNSLDVQTGDYTLSTWFFPEASAAEHYIAGKGACGENSSNFYIGVGSNYVPFIDISHASGGSRVSNGAIVLSQAVWHHLLLKKEGTTFKLFVDGVDAITHIETNPMNTGSQPFTIGKGDACTPPQLTTNGGVDEVRLYGRALTTAEIAAIFGDSARPGVKSNAVCQPQTAPPVSLKILYPNPVAGGRATQGEIKLANGAPSGGTTVNLISSDAGVMTVPVSVTVPEGFVQANFPITSTSGTIFRSADIIATLATDTARATVSVAPSAPDVAASNLIAPASVSILQNFAATWTITNVGQAPTESYREDEVWISSDNILFNDPNDRFIGIFYDNDGVLAVNASKTSSLSTVNIPSVAIPVDGTYYLFVRVGRNINERVGGNPQDNYISRPIQVNRNLPDLVAENIVAPTEVEPNVPFTINWNVRNAGSAATLGGFSNILYFSFDGTVGNADDIPLTFRFESPFGVNQSQSYSQQVIFPTLPVRPSSDSLVYVKVDTGNQVFEDNPGGPAEMNNTTTRAVRFEYRVPDLQVLTVTPPSEVESDTEFALAWTSTNAGDKNAVAFNERVFFSTDNIVNANDVQIGSFALPGGLAAGQSLNRIQNVTIPTNALTATGNYFVYVRTDADAAVNEGANENNNIKFQGVRVRRLLRPDLTVSSITAPATALFDQEIQVQWTINNAGQGPTNAPNWTDDLYLGLNQSLNGATRLATLSNVSFLNAGESYIASATVRIPRGSNGSYFVIVRTDVGNSVNEENENNNITTRPITINIPLLPDLRVSNVQAPAEGFAGAPISLNWTVTNAGTGATPGNENISTDGVYLSRDAGFSGDDILIGTRSRSGNLAVNATYSVSGFSVNLPTNVFGNYYVFAKADIYSQIYEFTSENNNDDYDRIQPGSPMNVLGTPPDLTVLSPITAPTAANAGQQIAVSFTVRNQGAFDAAGSWGEALYLSSDQTLNINDDTLLGAVARVNLPAGQQYPAAINATLPNCLNGTYYLFAVTDYSSRIFEFDAKGNAEANNISQPKAIQITNFAPDLRVTAMTVPPVAINGVMPMSWSVKNFGNGATVQTSWYDRVFVNTGTQIVNVGTFQRQGALAVDGEYTQNQIVYLPYNLEGSFQIFVRTDVYNGVPECAFDLNNDDSRPAQIQADLPDLRIGGVTSPNTAILGSSFNVNWSGQNFGTAMPTTSWLDRVYLSSNQTLDFGDTPIGSAVFNTLLGSGATYNGQAAVTIPNTPVGSYYLLVAADNGGNIEEGIDENNNVTAVPITLTAPAVDLQATNVTANPTLYAGQLANISWTVTNLGTNPTVSSNWTDSVILSRDSVYDATDRVLGYKPHAGALNGGANYPETISAQIPSGLTGEYNIFVITDRGNQVVENNEANNTSAPLAVNLELPPPAEFNITNISPPSSITLGESTAFTWTVQNASANAASGIWQDSVYLSTDTIWDSGDALVGQKQRSGSVNAFATYTESLNVPVPPVETGTYYVIVRTDARNTVRESNEANNVATSVGQTTVGITDLVLGTPLNTTLVTGQERFYSIFNTPADETMLVSLTGQTGSSNELFTRYGSIVSRSNYEVQGSRQGEPNQENVVGNTAAGTYYTMIRGDFVPASFAEDLKKADRAKEKAAITAEAVIVKAELLPFGIRTVSPGEAGNQGYNFLSIDGAKFQDGATVKLVGPGGVEITPIRVLYSDKSNIKALFDLNGRAAGNYQVVLTNPNSQSTIWPGNFRIKNGGGAQVRSEIVGAGEVSAGRFYRYIISTRNDGSNDALNIPIVVVLSQQLEYRLSTSNLLTTETAGFDSTTLPVHLDVAGKRVLVLYAPVIRSNESVNIGIDVKFGDSATITATSLPSFFEPNIQLQSPLRLSLGGTPTDGTDLLNCYANLLIKSLLMILSEIIPVDCAYSVANAILGLTADTGLGNFRNGFDAYSTLASLLQSAINVAGDCAKNAIRYVPWIKFASILYDIYQLTEIALDCVKKTFEVVFQVRLTRPLDPNEKIGPLGFGPERFVPIGKALLYRINFENKAEATAPAQKIRIVDQLPPTLDPRTFRLIEMGFKQTRVEVPQNRAFYQTRLQLGADLNNLKADISAGLDITTGRVTWNFTAVDPQTNEQPLNPNLGLLPPNNANSDGEGYVLFTIQPKTNQPTRTDLANQATIYFDEEEPIATNTTANLLDADIPVSSVAILPPTSQTPNFTVNWAGSDVAASSGLRSFDVFVSENGKPYEPFLVDTSATSATFNGKYGRSYTFYSIARDNAGNIELAPETPDAAVAVAGGAYEGDVAPRPNGDNDGSVSVADLTQIRRFVAGIDDPNQTNEFQRADVAPLIENGDGALSVSDIIQARRFAAGLDTVAESAGPLTAAPFSSKTVAGKNALLLPREIRGVRISRFANRIKIGIEIEAQGDEVAAGFTLNFNPAVLSNPSNIALGSGANGATLTTNINQSAQGRVGVILDKNPTQPLPAGTLQLLTIEFDIAASNPSTAMIGFGNIPVRREVVNGTATPLTTTFTDSVISLVAPTAAGVNVSGRVTNSGGRGISKTVITMTDGNGMVTRSLTNPFGYYAFENVASGQTYIISARHKKYQFAQPSIVVTLSEELTDADFVAVE